MVKKDLKGQRFGSLIVKEYIGNRKWMCMCDCGKKTVAHAYNLKSGHTQSCGCKRADAPLEGKVFGYLSVIERVKTKKRGTYYRCKCECGNICEVRSDALQSGITKSCGKCGMFEDHRISALVAESDTFIMGTQPSKLHSKPTKANKSGVVGVNWDKSRGKWSASIRFQGKKYNLGRFDTLEEAAEARSAAEKEIFGDFLKWYERYRRAKEKVESE